MTNPIIRLREALAQGPTEGPWHWVDSNTDAPFQFGGGNDGYPSLRTVEQFGENKTEVRDGKSYTTWALPKFILDADSLDNPADAAFIAACSPEVIRSLLSTNDELRSKLEAAEKALQNVLDCVHQGRLLPLAGSEGYEGEDMTSNSELPALPEPMSEGELWSWVRSVMSTGADIWCDSHAAGKGYKYYSMRLDAVAAKKADELTARFALTPERAAPEKVRTDCPRCNGAGTIRSTTSHLGPDDYDFDESCPACYGTGSPHLNDAILALGYWTHKTDVERIVVERAEVLRIVAARAALREALAQPPAGASAGEAPSDAQIDAALREISDAAENHNDMYGLPMESADWSARFRLVIRNLIAAPSSSVTPPHTVGDLMKWREAVLEEVYTAILMMPKGDKAARFDVCTMIRKMKESAPPSEQAP